MGEVKHDTLEWGRWYPHEEAPRGSYACLARLHDGAEIKLAWMPAQGRPKLPSAIVMPFIMPEDEGASR